MPASDLAASRSCHELRPVMKQALEGADFELQVKALRKRMPRDAMLSKAGVCTQGVP